MNCIKCGEGLKENAKFCVKCGEKVQQVEAPQVEEAQVVANETTTAQTPEVVEKGKQWLGEFIHFSKALLKKPFMSVEEINGFLSEKTVYINAVVFMVLSSLLGLLAVQQLMKKAFGLLGGLDYTIGNIVGMDLGLRHLSINDIEFEVILKIILANTLYIGLFVALLVVLMIGFSKFIRKQDSDWKDYLKLMLMPLLVLTIGTAGLVIAAFLGMKLTLVVYMVTLFMFASLTVVQYIHALGKKPIVIYGVPVIFLVALYLQMYIGPKVILGILF